MARWVRTERPSDSQHKKLEGVTARVMPGKHGGFKWTIWLGESGRKCLFGSGTVCTRRGAIRRANRELKIHVNRRRKP